LKGWILKFDNFGRYHYGTKNSSLISGKVCSINVIDMDLRFLDMASDIKYHHQQSQLLLDFEGVDHEI
jgi:hypothetical protein